MLFTQTVEVIPKKRREVIGGKYLVQYFGAACASAGSVSMMEAIGIGPTATISKFVRYSFYLAFSD